MRGATLLLLSGAAAAFDLSAVSIKNESDALYYYYGGKRISPWHDVPFSLAKDEQGVALLSFVCEIPRGTREKFEIHKSNPHNPVQQDVNKDGSLRSYAYSPSLINYGAIAQTWEDPNVPDEDTGFEGDNDPVDVLQLNEAPCERGAIHRVLVLGSLALVDDDETDWKLLVVNVDDPAAPAWRDVSDVPVERVNELREWFRNYKTAEGKGQNKFGLDERAVDAEHARRVALGTHELWAAYKAGTSKGCKFKKTECWIDASSKDEL